MRKHIWVRRLESIDYTSVSVIPLYNFYTQLIMFKALSELGTKHYRFKLCFIKYQYFYTVYKYMNNDLILTDCLSG